MQTIIDIAQNWDGSAEQKKKFHRDCKKWLKCVADEMKLDPKDYDIRSNPGGPAVLGDVILHTDSLYVNLGGSYYSSQFMYRSCKGRKDYTGGRNNWMLYEDMCNLQKVVYRFQNPLGW